MNVKRHVNYGKPIVYKSLVTDIKADTESRKVSGYLASFGTKDSDSDIIVKGAFTKSINERGVNSVTDRKIAYLWQHDMKEPIGKFTLLQEDEKGLYFEAEVSKIPLGDRVLAQYADGTLNQHSIGFQYVWDKMEYDEETDAFIIKEVNLFEGSVVTMGANENTPFTGMKAADIDNANKDLKKEFESYLKRFSHVEQYELKQFVKKHIEITKQEPFNKDTLKHEPSEDTQQFDLLNAIKNL